MPRKYTKKKNKKGGTPPKTIKPDTELQSFNKLPEQTTFFSNLDSQIPEKMETMSYTEFIRNLQNESLYGCFNLLPINEIVFLISINKIPKIRTMLEFVRDDGLHEVLGIDNPDYTGEGWDDNFIFKCAQKIQELVLPERAVHHGRPDTTMEMYHESIYKWYEEIMEYNEYIYIDDLNEIIQKMLPEEEAKPIFTKIYEKLPKYREKNLENVYNFYLEEIKKINKEEYLNQDLITQKQQSFAQTLSLKSKGLVESHLNKILHEYPFDIYLNESWINMWINAYEDILFDPYIDLIIDKMLKGKEVDDITKQKMILTVRELIEKDNPEYFKSKIPPFDMNTYLELLKLNNNF